MLGASDAGVAWFRISVHDGAVDDVAGAGKSAFAEERTNAVALRST